MADILGNLAWVILGLILAVILGWKVFRYFLPKKDTDVKPNDGGLDTVEVKSGSSMRRWLKKADA